mgnify:CR=1 FL=1
MKQLLYHIVFCCLAAVFFTACDKDDTLPVTGAGGDGNSIILDLASASLPVSRATVQATGAEVAVSHLDVLIFDGNGNKEWHERVSGSAGGSGKITLSAKRSDFAADEKYWVYLIANSTAEADVFDAEDFDLNKLRGMTQEDQRIHVTGLDVTGGAPQTFLMDGIAYPKGEKEPETAAAVELNNGEKADDTELQVTLRRAAAKIVVKIEKGEHVRFDNNGPDATNPGYYLRNMPYSTSVLPPSSMDAQTARLRTPDLFNGNYFAWTPDLITVTAYAYAHTWEDASTLEKEVRLIVNIPMYNTPRDETGKPTGDEEVYLPSSYYQIPVSASKELNRNTCYEVTVTVDAPGGSAPSKPVPLTGITYSVYEWQEEQVNVGDNGERPAYLTLNKYEMEMHNMVEDNTTLEFASSSAVTATIDRVYYIDKFGQERDLEIINDRNPDEWGEETTTGGWYPQTDWKNRCTIKITPDANITGKIDVFGTVPENNAVRYIEFTVSNDDNISRTVKVAQYPLTYITNVEGYYSYRDDFVSTASDGTRGVTTWELLAGKKINKGQTYSSAQVPYDNDNAWICGCSWNNNRWSYSKTGTGFFGSKVVVSVSSNTGLSNIEYARWDENRTGQSSRRRYTYDTETASVDLNNHRMYHVTITATSSEYTLGRPRITDGKTDPGEDNAVLVSPSFMLASQLGAVMDANNVNIAASHCEQYVEVAQDGKVYDDWRLPTRAEIEIIYKYQNDSDAMDEVLSGESYWSASPNAPIRNPNPSSTGTYRIRCIRDAYDKKTGK